MSCSTADLHDFAQAFKRSQTSRERADDDPRAGPTVAEAQAAAPDDQRSDLLAPMLGGGRS